MCRERYWLRVLPICRHRLFFSRPRAADSIFIISVSAEGERESSIAKRRDAVVSDVA